MSRRIFLGLTVWQNLKVSGTIWQDFVEKQDLGSDRGLKVPMVWQSRAEWGKSWKSYVSPGRVWENLIVLEVLPRIAFIAKWIINLSMILKFNALKLTNLLPTDDRKRLATHFRETWNRVSDAMKLLSCFSGHETFKVFQKPRNCWRVLELYETVTSFQWAEISRPKVPQAVLSAACYTATNT